MSGDRAEAQGPPMGAHLLLFDGSCGLCDRFVRRVAARDRARAFWFAPLQDGVAAAALARHGQEATLATVHVVTALGTAEERVLVRSDAVLFTLRRLAGWGWLGRLGRLVPRTLRDLLYGAVARVRYRVFGRKEVCALPAPGLRARLLTDPALLPPPR